MRIMLRLTFSTTTAHPRAGSMRTTAGILLAIRHSRVAPSVAAVFPRRSKTKRTCPRQHRLPPTAS